MRIRYIILLIMATAALQANDDTFAKRISALEGRHFILGFMQNEIEGPLDSLILDVFITSREVTEVTIEDPYYGTKTITTVPNQIHTIRMSPSLENKESEIVKRNMLFVIKSEKPVSVFCFNSRRVTSDSYTAVPVSRWGTEYVIISMPNDQYAAQAGTDSVKNAKPRRSEFLIMSAYDSTFITFTPTTTTDKGKSGGIERKIMLMKGECYLVQSYKFAMGMGDLSGTIVKGNKPFGVISGHVRTSVPQGMPNPLDSKDHLADMLMPVNNWGTKFATAPFGLNSTGDFFKITSYYPETNVSYYTTEGSGSVNLSSPGDFAEFKDINSAAYWVSDKPVQLAQLMMHNGYFGDTEYDPSLVTIPPVEQYIQKVTVCTQGHDSTNPYQYEKHWMYLLCDAEALDNLKYDKINVKEFVDLNNQIVPGTTIHYAAFEIVRGQHTVETEKGSFTGVLYGTGRADSYAMILGIGMIDPSKPDPNPPSVITDDSCGIIRGVITDILPPHSSGLDFAYVVEDSTSNFEYSIDLVTDTSTIINFTAKPIDIFKNAYLLIEIKDKAGNFRRYRYFFSGITLNLTPDKLNFNEIDATETSLQEFRIKFTGNDSLRIESATLKNNDPRLKFSYTGEIPRWLSSKEDFVSSLEFTPNGDIKPLDDAIVIDFGCGRIVEIPIKGTVIDYSAKANGWDFGEVTIGDTVCHEVVLTNKGNISIEASGISLFRYTGFFSFDTVKKFPYTLKPFGSTYPIIVCFAPAERIDYADSGSFVNNFSIPNKFGVTGRGIAPKIPSVIIDWGNRRIGTTNDTVFYVHNEGNKNARMLSKGLYFKDKEISSTSIENVNSLILKKDSVNLNVSFLPETSGLHETKAKYTVDWKLHDTVSILLTGTGTIPVIKTYDIDFGTLPLYSRKTLNSLLYEVSGNEHLTIDTAYIVSGDIESFELGNNMNLLLTKAVPAAYLAPGTNLTEDVTFAPKRPGSHELIIELRHDAAPSYQRVLSRIKLTGYSNFAADETNLITQDSIFACKSFAAKVVIKNTGMTELNLQTLSLQKNKIQLDWVKDYNSLLPIKIKEDSILSLELKGFAKKGENDKAIIDFVMNDSLSRHFEYDINPVSNVFDIIDLSDIQANISDTVIIKIDGSYSKGIDLPVKFRLVLKDIMQEIFYQYSKDVVLLITEPSGKFLKYPLKITQETNQLIIEYPADLMLPSDGCTWSLTLKFKALLGSTLGGMVFSQSDFSDCFVNDSIDFYAGVNQVCMYKYSRIQKIEGMTFVRAYPNPVGDKLNLEMDVAADDVFDIELTDNLGKKISLASNLSLKKGNHSLIFERLDLTDGVYILSVISPQAVINTKLVKRK